MVKELKREIYESGFNPSITYVLMNKDYQLIGENITKPIYAYNFHTKNISILDKKYYSSIHVNYETLFDEFNCLINDNSSEQKVLYFEPFVIIDFEFDELLKYDFTKIYYKLNLPQLNCTFRIKNYEPDFKLGLCMWISYEDYDNNGDIDRFNAILNKIVDKYKYIVLKHYEFIKCDGIRQGFVTENGVIVQTYHPTIFVSNILLNIDEPERILINKLMLDLGAV